MLSGGLQALSRAQGSLQTAEIVGSACWLPPCLCVDRRGGSLASSAAAAAAVASGGRRQSMMGNWMAWRVTSRATAGFYGFPATRQSIDCHEDGGCAQQSSASLRQQRQVRQNGEEGRSDDGRPLAGVVGNTGRFRM